MENDVVENRIATKKEIREALILEYREYDNGFNADVLTEMLFENYIILTRTKRSAGK